ncbi:RHS repeat domain-containing protein [Sulfurimonas sp.]|jgi:RHS repeat-associated protein|uniref:RHS repeat domain-containing protein n=1 Tax=Sulfurimonas sp. TaxID=2022749 RepID=UPI0025EFB31D|nr:RHS repeat-associated core domain-containing protein [Sulfurimonas sp.]
MSEGKLASCPSSFQLSVRRKDSWVSERVQREQYEYKINKDRSVEDKYFIYVGSKVMSIYTSSLNETSTKYLHYDSLNSVDTITNNLGVVESRMAYKPFGEKLNLDKDGKKTQTPPKTKRGYTGHEHVEETQFINMNARLYDPTIARFISADSIVPYMFVFCIIASINNQISFQFQIFK